jgi:uncharacterized membrane protein YfcA
VLGLAAGVLSGLFGVGGGLIIVPVLILVLKMDVRSAAGTSLAALLLPVGALGAYTYWRDGHVQVLYASLLALGLFVGAFLGANLALQLPTGVLERALGAILVATGVRLLIWGA